MNMLERWRAGKGYPVAERIAFAVGPVRFANGVLYDQFNSSVGISDGRLIDREQLVQCAALVRGLELISSCVADLFTDTLHICDREGRRIPRGSLTKNQRALLDLLCGSPNKRESSNEFFTNLTIDYLMSGNSVLCADRTMGTVSRIRRMVSETITAGVTPQGVEYYTGEMALEPRGSETYSESNICHIRYRNLSGMQIPDTRRGFVNGLSHILERTLSINIALDQYVRDYFESDANGLRIAVESDLDTSKKAQEDFKGYLRNEVKSGASVIFVPKGMKLVPIQSDASDQNMANLRDYQIREIARGLGVPTYALGLDKAGVQIETIARDIYSTAIKPHVNAIKGALTHAFLNRMYESKGFRFEIDPTMLLRGNTAAVVSVVQATKGDAQTPQLVASQELRKLLGLPPEMPEDVNAAQIERGLAARQQRTEEPPAGAPDSEGQEDDADK